ncbi:hypothetical protein C4564_03020 [Candidatus Microgenomates bacterium]|nr:MAG: hypothetical protein C4564_03020 [Candidatus Microgenomates bacterium]
MQDIEFYDVKKRAKVSVPASQVKKTKYERATKDGGTQVRYAVKASIDGSSLTKFVSKDTWDSLNVPEA